MPTTSTPSTLNGTAADILNAIRNASTANYRAYVPTATPDMDSIRAIGNVIMQFPALQNEFLSALINRIGRVLITSKMWENPWTVFKKGQLEFGETIEEVFVNLAKPFQYDPAVAESKVFKRETPDVRAAFHIMNYQKFYKSTIQSEQLRQAFLSWNGITELIAKIVEAMYTAANYDEFVTMKYMLARHILNGELYPSQVSAVAAANMKTIASTIKGVSNLAEFNNTKYNLSGVNTHSLKENQYLIVNADFDATMDVEVLASAFNMSKAEFMGHRIMIDSFGELDDARLNALFGDDPNYVAITSDEKTALNAIPAVLVDRDWFMILDNLYNFTEQYNGEGLYWNYWYHVWKTFSVSPFATAVVFVPGAPAVSSVTVTPESATILAGQRLNFTATVATAYFASQAVNWTVVDSTSSEPVDGVEINIYGELSVGPDVANNTGLTVKATSVLDSTKYDTATVTVSNPT